MRVGFLDLILIWIEVFSGRKRRLMRSRKSGNAQMASTRLRL